jgi:hypothetical protein
MLFFITKYLFIIPLFISLLNFWKTDFASIRYQWQISNWLIIGKLCFFFKYVFAVFAILSRTPVLRQLATRRCWIQCKFNGQIHINIKKLFATFGWSTSAKPTKSCIPIVCLFF